ncbi:MAG: type IV toxin-antitoxin system AbiEi family antitoxin domain-containing protein [Candidatus Protochlamydia sp.]|nr:type IV toxin-antitoxin system AbiEi family antitoxin domain-containing protein [Candidatus Protochlamydia sp.]
MRDQNKFDLIRPIFNQPCFNVDDVKKLGVSPSNMAYFIKKGLVRKLARGVYQSTDYEGPVENFMLEDLIDCINSIRGGVICLISALSIYDITDEFNRSYWIAVSHNTSVKKRSGIRIVRFRNMELGRTTIDLHGVQVPIFDRERTIIDTFRLLSKETAIKALKMALKSKDRLDLIKLQSYSKQLRFNISPYLMTATT